MYSKHNAMSILLTTIVVLLIYFPLLGANKLMTVTAVRTVDLLQSHYLVVLLLQPSVHFICHIGLYVVEHTWLLPRVKIIVHYGYFVSQPRPRQNIFVLCGTIF